MLKRDLLVELQRYVQSHLIILDFCELKDSISEECISEESKQQDLEDFINRKRKQTFAQLLFSLIDKKAKSDAEIYKKAGIDRRHFSKIRSNPDYRLGKHTAIALAIALELNQKETDELLSSAGFSLSDNDTFDLVIQFCLDKNIYDIDHVNEALDYFSLKPLIR